MDNAKRLEELKKLYDANPNYIALKDMQIEDNKLIITGINQKLSLNNINLNDIKDELFTLRKEDIFDILFLIAISPYIVSLYRKPEITLDEEQYIDIYVNKYIEINSKLLSNEFINLNEMQYMVPVNMAYDSTYENSPVAKKIADAVNQHMNEIEGGKGNHKTLVLKPSSSQNFIKIVPDENSAEYVGKAGFTTLVLISGAIIATCAYLMYFFMK